MELFKACEECSGTGQIDDGYCIECEGGGKVITEEGKHMMEFLKWQGVILGKINNDT